jgi:hypothetical protein
MKAAADFIENLLRPHGLGFVFCSFQQAMEWRSAPESAGGDSSLIIPAVPEVITRNKMAVNSGGRFLYHRIYACEVSWLFHKAKPGAARDEYQATVRFWNSDLELCPSTRMPTYTNIFDNKIPPRGAELICANGCPVRAEQKSVNLLRDLIRLFAPEPNDIVVDFFRGNHVCSSCRTSGRTSGVCMRDGFRVLQHRTE